MKYVNMNEAAYDQQDIVFPGLGNCHGVVYSTNNGLFAYHIYGTPLDSPGRAAEFGRFVTRHAQGQAVGGRLCGACPSNRYANAAAPKPEHLAELVLFANALGFNGPIWGATWDTAALGWNTTYCAVSHTAITDPPVTVRIENFTHQDLQNVTAVNASPNDHKLIGIKKVNAYPGSAVVSSSIKTPTNVITGVTRKPGTPSVIVALHKLR